MLNSNLISLILNDSSQTAEDLKDSIAQTDTAFRNNIIYPHLSELLYMKADLKCVKKYQSKIQDSLDKGSDLTSVEVVKKILKQENVSIPKIKQRIEEVFMFIEWALPLLEERIRDGWQTHNTVDSSLDYQWKNLSSARKLEGYIFINIASDSSDGVKVYYCQIEETRYKGSQDVYWLIDTERCEDVPLSKPMIVQSQVKNNRSACQRNQNPDPTMVWVTALEPYSLPQTLKPVSKHRFVARLFNVLTDEEE